jgi:hypothetical protein
MHTEADCEADREGVIEAEATGMTVSESAFDELELAVDSAAAVVALSEGDSCLLGS